MIEPTRGMVVAQGRSPEHDDAKPRKGGLSTPTLAGLYNPALRGRADKNGPNRSPLLGQNNPRHPPSLAGVVARDCCSPQVGVFRHAPIERGGGGGKVDGRKLRVYPVDSGLYTDAYLC